MVETIIISKCQYCKLNGKTIRTSNARVIEVIDTNKSSVNDITHSSNKPLIT
jgi:hypothetical protein